VLNQQILQPLNRHRKKTWNINSNLSQLHY